MNVGSLAIQSDKSVVVVVARSAETPWPDKLVSSQSVHICSMTQQPLMGQGLLDYTIAFRYTTLSRTPLDE